MAISIALIGCAAPNPIQLSANFIPATGQNGSVQVHEYAIVEESTDNPDHVAFQQRVLQALATRQAGGLFAQSEQAVYSQNQTLALFDFHLETNPSPPFSGYALYHNGSLVQRDIAHFGSVSLKDRGSKPGRDFQFGFETLRGEKLVVSMAGIRPSLGEDQSAGSRTLPIDVGSQMAYADSIGLEGSAYASVAPEQHQGPAAQIKNGNFGWQMINGEPFYFYSRGDVVHLNYGGNDLAYIYDQVVYGKSGNLAIFNPGNIGRIAWFYGLRDGVWYYVEVGNFS